MCGRNSIRTERFPSEGPGSERKAKSYQEEESRMVTKGKSDNWGIYSETERNIE